MAESLIEGDASEAATSPVNPRRVIIEGPLRRRWVRLRRSAVATANQPILS